MRILYGVCGYGMGHVMRSAVVGAHLAKRGHELCFASERGAKTYLEKRGAHVIPIVGLGAVMVRNQLDPVLTVLSNLLRQTNADHLGAFANVSRFKPDVVISDFDPWTARYAALTGRPLVAVDNVHFMNRCRHPEEVVSADRYAASLMQPVANAMVPGARHYLVTSFVDAETISSDTSLHQPILRPAILAAKGARNAGHLVAYFNDEADHSWYARALGGAGVPVRLYGRKNLRGEERSGNVTFCPFSDDRFIDDLATCSAVVGGAGFTLMTEAIYLGKPMLAVPFGNQYEQILNANYLEALGFGERWDGQEPMKVTGFMARAPAYADQLRGYVHDHNRELLACVEAHIC